MLHSIIDASRPPTQVAEFCPTDEQLAAWIDLGLPAPEWVRVDTHVKACQWCQKIVGDVLSYQFETAIEAKGGAQ